MALLRPYLTRASAKMTIRSLAIAAPFSKCRPEAFYPLSLFLSAALNVPLSVWGKRENLVSIGAVSKIHQQCYTFCSAHGVDAVVQDEGREFQLWRI